MYYLCHYSPLLPLLNFVQLQIQMREAITNLCKEQNSSLQRLILHHNLDPKTSSKTQKYYRQIRKIYHHFDQQTYNLEDLMRAAIVIAEKSQLVYNIRGEKIKGLALSLNEMIKQNNSLGKLINIIKVFITHSKVLEEELREDLTLVVQEVAFGHNFVEKFQRAMEYFDFQERSDEAVGYKSVFKSFTWLFFLQTRQRLGIQSQFQSDYLLISVLYLTVRYAFDYLRPKNIPHLDKSRTNQKNLVTSILQKLFQIFLIDDIDSFKRITSMVDDYFQSLIGSDTIKCLNFQCYDFLSPRLINVNYRKIDLLYQKQRNPNSIDYRLFFNNRLETLTPRRFSQISQVKEAIDAKKRNFKQKSFASHKILTFQPEQSTQKSEQSQKFQQIKLPMNVKVSPSNTKTPMIWAFQQSPCSPIENFMHREVRLSKTQHQRYADQEEIIDCIRNILGEYCDNLEVLEDKVYLTYNYYLVLMDKYLKQNSEEDSNDLHSSGLVYALEIMICSISVPAIQPQKIRALLSSIREYIVTNGYYLWLINNFFQKVRDRLPSQIRELITIMDELIINQLIWEQDQISDSFLEIYHTNLCRNSGKDNANMANLLEKVIGHIEDHVARLMSEFVTLQNCQQIQMLIDKTIKYIVLQTPEIIKTHNLLQIILCSFYLVFRANGASIKFNEIVTAFQQINSLKHSLYKRIINEIEIEVEQGLVYCNIIEFYNKYFLSFIKEHRREIECWNYNPIMTVVDRSKSEKKEEPPRFSFQAMKENHQKRLTMTEESQQHNKKSSRLQSQASPPSVQTELPLKEKPDRESFSMRNETTMRSRPIGALRSCLNTEKIKSPVNIR